MLEIISIRIVAAVLHGGIALARTSAKTTLVRPRSRDDDYRSMSILLGMLICPRETLKKMKKDASHAERPQRGTPYAIR